MNSWVDRKVRGYGVGAPALHWACDLLHTLSRVQVPGPPKLLLTQSRRRRGKPVCTSSTGGSGASQPPAEPSLPGVLRGKSEGSPGAL